MAIVRSKHCCPRRGRGACRPADDEQSRALLAPLNHAPTALQVIAERAFLAGLGGGCAVPVAAYAWTEDERLHLHGCVTAPDGARQVDVRGKGAATLDGARRLGERPARNALKEGARELLRQRHERPPGENRRGHARATSGRRARAFAR